MSRDVMRWRANLKRLDAEICRKCGKPFPDVAHDPEGHVFEAEKPITQVSDEYDQKAVDVIKNLAMLVRRLCHRLNKHEPDSKIVTQSLDYLRGEGLQGSILRSHPCPQCSKPLSQFGTGWICDDPKCKQFDEVVEAIGEAIEEIQG